MDTVQKHIYSNQEISVVYCLMYTSTLSMESTGSSETSAGFQQTARRFVPEDRTRHGHCCENLRYNALVRLSSFEKDGEIRE
jgi:hypothetical protein